EGAEAGLSSGVQSGDTVVVDGADKLQDGTRVEIAGEKPQPAATTPGAKPGRSGRGRRGAGPGGSHP
ncbi:MAG: hypothetical protein ACTHJX_13370, partial [Terriglobales bacterium]